MREHMLGASLRLDSLRGCPYIAISLFEASIALGIELRAQVLR